MIRPLLLSYFAAQHLFTILANAGPGQAAIPPATAAQVTPLQWLQQQTRPAFKPGSTLPPLGQMHCVNPPVELRAELARHWGFAVRLSRRRASRS